MIMTGNLSEKYKTMKDQLVEHELIIHKHHLSLPFTLVISFIRVTKYMLVSA